MSHVFFAYFGLAVFMFGLLVAMVFSLFPFQKNIFWRGLLTIWIGGGIIVNHALAASHATAMEYFSFFAVGLLIFAAANMYRCIKFIENDDDLSKARFYVIIPLCTGLICLVISGCLQ